MKTPSDDLFTLIHALSSSEKRYFTGQTLSSPGETPTYHLLFQILNSMKEYDEEKLKKKIRRKLKKREAEKVCGRLAVEKHYLYYTLLRVIRQYHYENNPVLKVREFLDDAIFLRGRGLILQAQKMLDKARKEAKKIDHLHMLLEINKEARTLLWGGQTRNIAEHVQALIDEKVILLQRIKKEFDYHDLYDTMGKHIVQRRKLTEAQKSELKSHPLFSLLHEEEGEDLSAYAFIRRRQCRSFYFRLFENSPRAIVELKQLTDWWEEHPEMKKADFFRYQLSWSMFMEAHLFLGKLDEIHMHLKKLQEQSGKSPAENIMTFNFTISYQFYTYLNDPNQLDKAAAMVPFIDRQLKKLNLPSIKKISITYNVGVMFFLMEKFKDCGQWLNRIIKIKTNIIEGRKDLRRTARILQIIALFESALTDESDNRIKSALNYFRREKVSPQTFEWQLLTHIKRITTVPLLESKAAYEDLKDFLVIYQANTEGSLPPALEETLIWVKSRLRRVSMIEIMQKPG